MKGDKVVEVSKPSLNFSLFLNVWDTYLHTQNIVHTGVFNRRTSINALQKSKAVF